MPEIIPELAITVLEEDTAHPSRAKLAAALRLRLGEMKEAVEATAPDSNDKGSDE